MQYYNIVERRCVGKVCAMNKLETNTSKNRAPDNWASEPSTKPFSFLQMADILPGNFFIYDLHGQIIYQNKAQVDFFKDLPNIDENPESFLGMHISEITQAIHKGNTDEAKEAGKQIEKNNTKVIQERRPFVFREIVPIRNASITFISYKAPLFDTSGYIIGIYGYAVNVTAYQTTQNAMNELKASMASLLHFWVGTGKDLQEPLKEAVASIEKIASRAESGSENHRDANHALKTLQDALSRLAHVAMSEGILTDKESSLLGLSTKTPPIIQDNPPTVTVASVEDDPIVTLAMQHMFQTLFPTVAFISFASANTALKRFKDPNHPIDLFLLDISLPDLQGDQLAQELRQMPHIPRATPIVALTGYDVNDDKNVFDCIYKKPVTAAQLKHILSHHLSHAQYSKIALSETV